MMEREFTLSFEGLTEETSLALVRQIRCCEVVTPLSEGAIATTYVRQSPTQPPADDLPLLLLHGFDSSVLEFRRLLPLLAEHRTTWAIDLLGFGFTERRPDLPFSPAAIKTHLYYTWKTLINRPVVLVGASMGGAAAIDFALTYPEVVSHLILLNSAGYSAGPMLGKYLFSPLDRWAAGVLARPKVRQDVALKAYHDPRFASDDAYHCGALHLTQPGWLAALAAFTRSGGYGSFKDQLKSLRPPTLILWGRSDRILGTQDALRFFQTIPHSRLVWIEASGHVPHLEQARETAKHILEFL